VLDVLRPFAPQTHPGRTGADAGPHRVVALPSASLFLSLRKSLYA